MKLCKPFWKKHDWQRYGELVEQLFTGGHMSWYKCLRCAKIKFDWYDPLDKANWKKYNIGDLPPGTK